MSGTLDPVALNEWIVCGWIGQLVEGQTHRTRVLGHPIEVARTADEHTVTQGGDTPRVLPVQIKFGCIFTCLGVPGRPLPDIPEFDELDRVVACCGSVGVHTSPYRIIENFIDMAHFSFIHTGVLGTAEATEVQSYKAEHRKDIDEVWATDCLYVQPLVPHSPLRGEEPPEIKQTLRNYRIMSPFSAALFKAGERDPSRNNVTAMFIQPVDETNCLCYNVMAFVGPPSIRPHIVAFQQAVFLQDRIVLENQVPALLPLDPTHELPTKADASSIAFRRWLKAMDIRFGILERTAA